MKNVIYNICDRLRGYSGDTEYFEVLRVDPYQNNDYVLVVRLVNTEAENKEEVKDESN